jgi:alpha-amylase
MIFENAFRNAYEPFVAVLERHPSVGVDFHFSGILLDWLDHHQPALLERIAALVRRGQCGLLAGAYHEPILPPIPTPNLAGSRSCPADTTCTPMFLVPRSRR